MDFIDCNIINYITYCKKLTAVLSKSELNECLKQNTIFTVHIW